MNSEEQQPSTELVPMPPVEALGVFREPSLVLEEARKAAQALMKVVEAKKRRVTFNGETFLEFEDWQTLGRFYSMTVVVKSTKEVEYGETRGWEATAEVLLVPTNQVISSAEAMCMRDEGNWAKKPEFQLRSMAQTRACAKALRNVLAWVVVLAGYKPTPGEEMGAGERIVEAPKAKPKTKSTERVEVPSESDMAEGEKKILEYLIAAPTMGELAERFSKFYKQARTASDTDLMGKLYNYKEVRKKELQDAAKGN